MKTKNLTVSNGWHDPNSRDAPNQFYRVEKIVNSVDYQPGQLLHHNEVHHLCQHKAWTVTVVPFRRAT